MLDIHIDSSPDPLLMLSITLLNRPNFQVGIKPTSNENYRDRMRYYPGQEKVVLLD